MLTLIYILLSLYGCGLGGAGYCPPQHDTELLEWAAIFEEDGLDHGIEIEAAPMRFTDSVPNTLNPNTVGYCQKRSNGVRIVYIVREFWNRNDVNDALRYSLILHEQGHCAFNLDHTDGGIMNSIIVYPTDKDVDEFWESIR